jgi:hypothetical protein
MASSCSTASRYDGRGGCERECGGGAGVTRRCERGGRVGSRFEGPSKGRGYVGKHVDGGRRLPAARQPGGKATQWGGTGSGPRKGSAAHCQGTCTLCCCCCCTRWVLKGREREQSVVSSRH